MKTKQYNTLRTIKSRLYDALNGLKDTLFNDETYKIYFGSVIDDDLTRLLE